MTNVFTRRVGRYVALSTAAVAIAGTAALGLAATSNAAPEIGNQAGQGVEQVQPFDHDLNLNNLPNAVNKLNNIDNRVNVLDHELNTLNNMRPELQQLQRLQSLHQG